MTTILNKKLILSITLSEPALSQTKGNVIYRKNYLIRHFLFVILRQALDDYKV
jgi:hypothetical protein